MGDYVRNTPDEFVSLSCWRMSHGECLGYSHRTARGERAPDAMDCHCTCHRIVLVDWKQINADAQTSTLPFVGPPACDDVCDWYYSAPEDRPSVCPTCGEEFDGG